MPKTKREKGIKRTKSTNTKSSTYVLYSDRIGKNITVSTPKKNGSVSFVILGSFYPRFDGCDFEDHNKGEKLYLIQKNQDGSTKKISVRDLSTIDMRNDLEWNELSESISEEEENMAKLPSESRSSEESCNSDDEEFEHKTAIDFIKDTHQNLVKYTDDHWNFLFNVDRARGHINLDSVNINFNLK